MKLFRGANVIRMVLLVVVLAAVSGWILHRRMINRGSRTHFTVEDRLRQYEPTAGARVSAYFNEAKIAYPPAKLVLVGLKAERKLQIYAPDKDGALQFVHEYPILAASGHAGPKLQEGDGQVPEGIYKIDSLNPNSLYHLALRVGYPNEWDQARAQEDGRKDLGGDIMIHGANGSVGCLAMGDPVSEDIFVLAAKTGIENISLILSPVDFRVRNLPTPMPPVPAWTEQLYANVKRELSRLPEPKETR
jgi:murein L,D-transpeptidase YafK